MDEWRPGMEDEATEDPDGVPWSVNEPGASAENDEDEDIIEFDKADWVDPHWVAAHQGNGAEEDRGSGPPDGNGAAKDRGSGPLDESGVGGGKHCGSGDAPQPELTTAADRHYCQHAEILRHLQTVQEIAKNDINGHIGAQLSLTVQNIVKQEEKKLKVQLKGHPDVLRVMAAKVAADNSYYKQRRLEFADAVQQKQKHNEAKQALKRIKEDLQEIKRKTREHAKRMHAVTAARVYTLQDLGDGKLNGGTKEHMRNRFAVLDRIKSVNCLTPPQNETWEAFKNMWDQRRKTVHSHEWGKIFAEKTKQVLDDVENGVPDALSKWMETERLLMMPHVQCLRVPAIEFVNYERYGKQ